MKNVRIIANENQENPARKTNTIHYFIVWWQLLEMNIPLQYDIQPLQSPHVIRCIAYETNPFLDPLNLSVIAKIFVAIDETGESIHSDGETGHMTHHSKNSYTARSKVTPRARCTLHR